MLKTEDKKDRGARWKYDEIKMLIALHGEMDNDFKENGKKQGKILTCNVRISSFPHHLLHRLWLSWPEICRELWRRDGTFRFAYSQPFYFVGVRVVAFDSAEAFFVFRLCCLSIVSFLNFCLASQRCLTRKHLKLIFFYRCLSGHFRLLWLQCNYRI